MAIFKQADGLLPNSLALSYILIGYPGFIFLLNSVWWLLAVLGLAHVQIIAAYLLHDCIHNALFSKARHNQTLGKLLAWLTGACYCSYSKLQQKHLRHHIERADVLTVDTYQLVLKHPRLMRVMRLASACFLPARELLTHALTLFGPWFIPALYKERPIALRQLLIRGSLFVLLGLWSGWALVGYAIAYVIFIAVLGFMDTFQHSYGIIIRPEGGAEPPTETQHYEELHTYSNLLSQRFPVINLLVLNFCYHNSHHHSPAEPWYKLPALHHAQYADNCPQQISFFEQLKRYRRFRLQRLEYQRDTLQTGADGVSFLVGV